MLRLLPPSKPKPDYHAMYGAAFKKAILLGIAGSVSGLHRAVYYGIRYAGGIDVSVGDAEVMFAFMQTIKDIISCLTPREMMQLFPIDKAYDGERWQSKDYFYTMKTLEEHGLDVKIGETVGNILWDYMNEHVMDFHVNHLSAVGRMHKQHTGREMLADFFESQGEHLTIYNKVTNTVTGQEFWLNNDTGELEEHKRPIPRYLKLVE